jgi:hypothetical protein
MNHTPLIPAQAGIQKECSAVKDHLWVPAFAGTSGAKLNHR